MNKEMTFGDAVKILEDIRREHPTENDSNYSQLELTTYAYIKGYEAALSDRKVNLAELKEKTASIESDCKAFCESVFKLLEPYMT